jgi:hypothetical protein
MMLRLAGSELLSLFPGLSWRVELANTFLEP